MEIVFLVDTNVFLEILLGQSKRKECKDFLNNNIGDVGMTDFSLHSIGVILFRYGREDVFGRFVEDVTPDVRILSLPAWRYGDVIKAGKSMDMDFDDAYQCSVAGYYGLRVVTMDRDFEKAEGVEVLFL